MNTHHKYPAAIWAAATTSIGMHTMQQDGKTSLKSDEWRALAQALDLETARAANAATRPTAKAPQTPGSGLSPAGRALAEAMAARGDEMAKEHLKQFAIQDAAIAEIEAAQSATRLRLAQEGTALIAARAGVTVTASKLPEGTIYRSAFDTLPNMKRAGFFRNGGKIVDDPAPVKTPTALKPGEMHRETWQALSPKAQAEHFRKGGKLVD